VLVCEGDLIICVNDETLQHRGLNKLSCGRPWLIRVRQYNGASYVYSYDSALYNDSYGDHNTW
jgi:hypothetical protein